MPFCARRCDYCAFATFTDRHHLRRAYVDACRVHLDAARRLVAGAGGFEGALPAATVFLGGGTPSQLEPAELARLIAGVERAAGAEVTVEANPEDVTEELTGILAAAGVTRLSLGVQSFDPVVLAGLGRVQEEGAVERAAALAGRAGLALSVDLIYGGAGETDESWARTVHSALGLDPAPVHVSAYALTVEAGTPLARDPRRHPDDDVQARRYEVADELFSAAGLRWYELSNWARPGAECRHNLNYWRQGDYLAIGSGAHGHRAGVRWWNLRTPDRYVAAARGDGRFVAVTEQLDDDERALEALQLSLRTREGVPAEALDLADEALDGLVAPAGPGRVALTRRGRLLANEVACRLRAGGSEIARDRRSRAVAP